MKKNPLEGNLFTSQFSKVDALTADRCWRVKIGKTEEQLESILLD
jgi:uncharacterized protein (DUF2249 family)